MATDNDNNDLSLEGFIEFGKDDSGNSAENTADDAIFDISGIKITDPDAAETPAAKSSDAKATDGESSDGDNAQENPDSAENPEETAASKEDNSEQETDAMESDTGFFESDEEPEEPAKSAEPVKADNAESDAQKSEDTDTEDYAEDDTEDAPEAPVSDPDDAFRNEKPHLYGNVNDSYDDIDGFFDEEEAAELAMSKEPEEAPQKSVEENLAAIGKAGHNSGVSVTDNIGQTKIVKKSTRMRKGTKFFGVSGGMIGLIMAVVFMFDMVALNSASYKVTYNIVSNILLANGIEALRLSTASTIRTYVCISYIISFVLGGLVVVFISWLINKVLTLVSFPGGDRITFYTALVFAVIFLIGGVITAIVTGGVFTFAVYRWIGPFMTYIGGVIFMLAAKFKFILSN